MERKSTIDAYQISLTHLTILTGFIAGVFGTGFHYLAHYFHLTSIHPTVVFAALSGKWKVTWIGFVVALLIYGILSIVAAALYYVLLRKRNSIVWGMMYGVVTFILVFFVFYPILLGGEPIWKKDFITFCTEICFYLLYGTFIGYSISYEYEEQLHIKEFSD
ncbi:YqhR family membrane protein [Bacillus sp. FJAT-50079]|uniref:YqhR family membrane protein n=1 Tax=Bacillus sp. FJAT-50079 TaxID=2833577 RepID=UPI001BC90849|nr:YqhR family membrane protein [Bacillus sp. FJAT-50079]MBS4209628.1 hypothetical protein [Bacillus sp. FJAT-50079]